MSSLPLFDGLVEAEAQGDGPCAGWLLSHYGNWIEVVWGEPGLCRRVLEDLLHGPGGQHWKRAVVTTKGQRPAARAPEGSSWIWESAV